MADALVSVVIPTYKREAFVRRAIDNVRRQTYHNIEILVVDDGSPDGTSSVVKGFGDPRIRYLRHPNNRGVSAARNTGIGMASGAFVAFMDDDDEWREDKLEKQVQSLREFDAIACMGLSNGHPTRAHRGRTIRVDDLRFGSFQLSSLVTKAHVIRDITFDEKLTQGEDWDFFIRVADRYSIGWLPEPLLIYNGGSHERASNRAKYLPIPELEKRAAVLYKHRAFLGERWFKYHLADCLLSHITNRPNKSRCIRYAISRCGFIAVLEKLIDRFIRRFERFVVTCAA